MVLTLARDYFPLQEDAEDAAQEILLRLHTNAARSPDNPVDRKRWAYVVAENMLRDMKRKERARNRLAYVEAVWADELTDTDEPSSVLEREEALAAFVAGWHNLPDKLRQTMSLRYEGGKSYDEIAELTGVAVGTVSSRIARAREMLQV